MSEQAQCKSCGAAIRWVVMKASGKRMPLDWDIAADGNVAVEDGITGIVFSGEGLLKAREEGRPLFLSHFVTCPDRVDWRRK